MSKTFGKIVLASTILAGASVGAYAYFKNGGKIPGTEKTTAKAPAADGDEFETEAAPKIRNYVDLASTTLEKPIAEAKKAVSEVAVEVKEGVTKAVKEVKGVIDEAAAKAADAKAQQTEEDAEAEETSETAEAPETEDAAETEAEAADEPADDKPEEEVFEEGLKVESVAAGDDHVIGGDTADESEEFFDDEKK